MASAAASSGKKLKALAETTTVMAALAVAALTVPRLVLFPFLVIYALGPLFRSVALGLLERLPDRDPLLDEDDEEEHHEAGAELRSMDYGEVAPTRPRREPTAGERSEEPR